MCNLRLSINQYNTFINPSINQYIDPSTTPSFNRSIIDQPIHRTGWRRFLIRGILTQRAWQDLSQLDKTNLTGLTIRAAELVEIDFTRERIGNFFERKSCDDIWKRKLFWAEKLWRHLETGNDVANFYRFAAPSLEAEPFQSQPPQFEIWLRQSTWLCLPSLVNWQLAHSLFSVTFYPGLKPGLPVLLSLLVARWNEPGWVFFRELVRRRNERLLRPRSERQEPTGQRQCQVQ